MGKADTPDGDKDFQNPDLGSFSNEWNLPCQTVDASQGKGNMMVWGKADWDLGLTGREVLVRLYDFNRKPGARRKTAEYLKEKVGFIDRCNGRTMENWEMSKVECPLECPLMTWIPDRSG